MEERNDLAAHGIYAAQIWALGEIAAMAREGKVVDVVRPPMLSRDDVLDVQGNDNVILRYEAILASVPRSPTDKIAS